MVDLNKLPKWVQTYIQNLQIQLAQAKEDLRLYKLENMTGATGLIELRHNSTTIPLADFDTVIFSVQGKKIQTSLSLINNLVVLDVNGHSQVSIIPQATNRFFVR